MPIEEIVPDNLKKKKKKKKLIQIISARRRADVPLRVNPITRSSHVQANLHLASCTRTNKIFWKPTPARMRSPSGHVR
jgi:hypothetical protein